MFRALRDLGMNTDTSFSLWEVKKAYRAAVVRHHPDKGGLISDFRRVQEAYEFLRSFF
jgi:curved DNA-binding protein CbpA